jgi:hypothetical protein
MARKGRPETPGRELVGMLLTGWLYAIPFTVFFALVAGGWGRAQLLGIYLVSLVFAYCNMTANWAARNFIVPAFHRREAAVAGAAYKPARILTDVATYVGTAILGSFLAAVIVHLFIFPGFLGSLRAVGTVAAFTLLFAALFVGLSYAYYFYKDSLARVRSEEELNLARRIQRSFLLSQFPARPGIEVHALNVSSKQVSGDFYDVVPAGERAFLLCVADVSGKGVPAALLSSMLQASLRTQAPIATSVGAMVTNVNHMLCQGVANGQFATMFLGRVDEATMSLSYVNAGHNHPVLLRANGTRELLDKGGPMVGILEAVPFEEGSVRLAPGDRIVLYTDGLSEAMDAEKEMYGDDRIADVAAALPADQSARESIDAIMAGISTFLDGVEPQDDMTLMVLRVLGPQAAAGAPQQAALPAVR